MDRTFLKAAGLELDPLRDFIATGASDEEVAAWMQASATTPKEKLVAWGRRFRKNPLWLILVFEDWLHQRRHRKARG